MADYTKAMMEELRTAHEKTRQQDEQLREERKAPADSAPKRNNNRNAPANQEQYGQATRNYNGGGRGGRGQSSRGYATARDGGYNREDGAGRRGSSYNPRGRGGRPWNDDQAGEDSYQIRTRGTRGVGARGAGGRGSRGGPRGGIRGNAYEPRGRGGRGRGGRRDYEESQEVEYQSNPEDSDGDLSSEQEALTHEELNELERKYAECKDKLKNIVNETQIKNKFIDLEFNEDEFDQWVNTLAATDARDAGVKAFEWNATITKGEKLYDRKRKLQEGKRQEVNERRQAAKAAAKAAALEKKKETDAKRKEERAKAQATKLAEQEAREAQERAEREARGDVEPENEVVATTAQDADSGEKEEAPTKSRKTKGAAKEMVYQKKNRNDEDAKFKVKNGSKTNVYRKKEPVEQPVETLREVQAEQFEGEKKLDEYDEGKDFQEDAYANDQEEQDHATAGPFQANEGIRRQSDDESSDLLRQAAEHNQKDEQLQHEERQKAEQEKLKHEKEQAERRRKEEAVKRQQAHEQQQANKAREERARREAEEKAEADKREKEAREREEKEKAAEEARRAQAQKKADEAASEQAQQAVPNPFAHHPYMMPMALGQPASAAQTGDKADSATQQQQMLPLDQQQYYYQAMAAHQQMAHQYQAMLTHQFALQQQLLSQGQVGNSGAKASQSPATNNGAAGLQNPLAAQNPYAAMAGMPAGFPMMPPMSAGMPGMLPPGAVGDPSQNPMLQQQFMPMPGFVPMPMMYPNQQMQQMATQPQPGFNSKSGDKK